MPSPKGPRSTGGRCQRHGRLVLPQLGVRLTAVAIAVNTVAFARATSVAPDREAADLFGAPVQVTEADVAHVTAEPAALAETEDTLTDGCSSGRASHVENQFCTILLGSNGEVAGKLERVAKGISTRAAEKAAIMADTSDNQAAADAHVEAAVTAHLQKLQAALWDLWFCAKRVVPPCIPHNTSEPRYQGARRTVFAMLRRLHDHGVVPPSGAARAETPASLLAVQEAFIKAGTAPDGSDHHGGKKYAAQHAAQQHKKAAHAALTSKASAPATISAGATMHKKTPAKKQPSPQSSQRAAARKTAGPALAKMVRQELQAAAQYKSKQGGFDDETLLQLRNDTPLQVSPDNYTKFEDLIDYLVKPPHAKHKIYNAIHRLSRIMVLDKSRVAQANDEDAKIQELIQSFRTLQDCAAQNDCGITVEAAANGTLPNGQACCQPVFSHDESYRVALRDSYRKYKEVHEAEASKNHYYRLMIAEAQKMHPHSTNTNFSFYIPPTPDYYSRDDGVQGVHHVPSPAPPHEEKSGGGGGWFIWVLIALGVLGAGVIVYGVVMGGGFSFPMMKGAQTMGSEWGEEGEYEEYGGEEYYGAGSPY